MNFRITFHLDATGLYYDPHEPIHLDALLAWVLAPRVGVPRHLGRDDPVTVVPLPLNRLHVGGTWVYRASALIPEGPTAEDVQFWRKRFRIPRADLSAGAPNLTNGPYRDWNMPIPITLTRRLVAYGSGSRGRCRRLLREIRWLGKKRAHGHGKVIAIDLDEITDDHSITRDGRAMRWLPDPNGTRLVRVRPPYWNRTGRVTCCEVGQPWSLPHAHPPHPRPDCH